MAQVYRSGQPYGSDLPGALTPHEVRHREFSPRRRGVDAEEVRAFQLRVAEELTILQRELAMLAQENARLKRALRDWQAMHARLCEPQTPMPGVTGNW